MINVIPEASDLWAGIAGHFDSITQVLCEFIDNGIADLIAAKRQPSCIQITAELLDGKAGKQVRFQIEDTGAGISDLNPAMRLGDKTLQKNPLNEHGFGLKHALASANPENNNWALYTRTTKDFKNGQYRKLTAPYSFSMNDEVISAASATWPGSFNGSGTLVEFTTSIEFFNTVQLGIKGVAGFERCLEYLVEELGYIYAGLLNGIVTISVMKKGGTFSKPVTSIEPSWVDYYPPGRGTVQHDLGGGPVKIEYSFGQVKEGVHLKHYKKNQSTSGVEIRINGRVMMSNVFKDIWELENHPTFNHFLAIINLISTDAATLPKTRTTKNGIRSGDPKLDALFKWIRQTHPSPHKDLASATSEKELVEELSELKNKHIRAHDKNISTQFRVYKTLGCSLAADLYVFDGKDVVLYEAKKDEADIQDLYQLLLYWDGAVEDGTNPTEGVLLATSFSEGVKIMLPIMNSSKDRKGNTYKFITKTWADESITYPK